VQYGLWLWKVLHGDLGASIASGRPVVSEVMPGRRQFADPGFAATLIGFGFGTFFGFVAGYFRGSLLDRLASLVSILGVSVPHYWLGMVMVIVFSALLGWLPSTGAGPGGSAPGGPIWNICSYIILPAITMSASRWASSRAPCARWSPTSSRRISSRRCAAKGMGEWDVFKHVVRNAAPTALAVMGLQLGYLLGGSILIETVFAWPGTGFLLNTAIFQRDLPLLQGTILVLALFFVGLNLIVDVLQTTLDPRIQRG
jgi:peptide/nickel transport system permease protein